MRRSVTRRRRRRRAVRASSFAVAALVASTLMMMSHHARGGIVAKAVVKAARQAAKASAERETRGERGEGWFERAVDWARDVAHARSREDEDAHEPVVAFDGRSDERGDVDETWDAGDEDDAGDDVDATRTSESATTSTRESDGEGLGMRVLYEDTFDDVTARARKPADEEDACDVQPHGDVAAPARWLVALCARTSPTCRALAPELALLSLDSEFAPEDASGYGVGWIDCTSDASRAWCINRFDVSAVPKVIAILPGGREIPYEGTFDGAYVDIIRAWALEHGKARLGWHSRSGAKVS